MKNIIFFISIIFTSCAPSKIDKSMINDLLKEKLNSSYYTSYNKNPIIIIREAGNRLSSLSSYEYVLKDKKNWIYERKDMIIDSSEINNLKKKKENLKSLYWKKKDFIFLDAFEIIDSNDLKKNLKSNKYINQRLVIKVSKPLIIDDEHAMVYYSIQIADLIPKTLEKCTVLMEKSHQKWMIKSYYYDDNFE